MKKTIFWLVLTALFLSSCTKDNTKYSSDIPIAQFMIGKWKATGVPTTDITGSYLTDYELEFIDQTRLYFCTFSSYDRFCDNYTYKLISGKLYSVESERAKGEKLEISRVGDNLLVCLLHDDDCVEFTRQCSIWDLCPSSSQ